MVCLPEHFAYMSTLKNDEHSSSDHIVNSKDGNFKERVGGKLFSKYTQLALENQVWLSLGSFPESVEGKPEMTYQTHCIINDEGNIAAKYRKMHMFDVNFEDTDNLIAEESRANQMGNALAEPCFSPVGYLGLSISYDLRFPELYRQYILRGA